MAKLIPFAMATMPLAMIAILVLLPPLLEKSWRRLVISLVLTPFAVILPLAFFFLSTVLAPDSKDACHYGALDCFHVGKLALTPLVLWATGALYAVEILEVRDQSRSWITQGLILGAIISSVCLVFGVLKHWPEDMSSKVCLIVPLYTCIWYVARASYAVRTQPVDSTKLTIALTSSLPFWAVSALWSYTTYLSLPQHTPDCFVVTAASRGHRKFVGPFHNVTHRGCNRIANRQLATLWAFEALWRQHAPRSQAAFRRVYNVVGPIVARRIASPWMADAVYVVLKPVELFAQFAVKVAAFPTVKSETRHPPSLRFVATGLGSYILKARQS